MISKKSLYLLLPAVFMLWGYIGFKIYSHLGDGIDKPIYNNAIQKEVLEENVPDTFSLILDYKDPFLSRVIVAPSKSNKRVRRVKSEPKKIVWPEIVYLGRMVNQKTKKSMVSLTINGKEKIFSPGEIKEGVLIVKSFDDSIYVKYQREKKYIIK